MRVTSLLPIFALLFACTSCGATRAGDAAKHIVMFDYDGKPADPNDPAGPFSFWDGYHRLSDYPQHLYDIRDEIKEWAAGKEDARVLIFVHGGLNTQEDSIERAVRDFEAIKQSGAYPIFVNWRSGLISSYRDYVFRIRQGADLFDGNTGDKALALVTSPFVFVANLVRAAARQPLVMASQFTESLHWMGISDSRWAENAERAYEGPQRAALWAIGPEAKKPKARRASWWEYPRHLLFAPLKAASILVIDTGGTRSWDMMKRRVELLFQREKELDGKGVGKQGPLLILAMILRNLQLEFEDQGRQLRISLVGHSMGTIVANRLLSHANMYHTTDGEPPVQVPCFKDVVYLGAACSVREYESSVLPYLQAHQDTEVYHVVLNPSNETRELNAWDAAPRGSLLTWVDEFLARPNTLLERTAGRHDNLIVSLPNTPESLRNRVHLRVLPIEEHHPAVPQTHGDFSRPMSGFRYWDPSCWSTPGR